MKQNLAQNIGKTAGAEMVTLLKAIFADFQIIDTSFPMMNFSWLHEDVVALLDPAASADSPERRFYARFRQEGGHLPLLTGADLASYTLTRPENPGGGARPAIIACHATVCAALLEAEAGFAANTIFLVSGVQEGAALDEKLAQHGFAQQIAIIFVRPRAVETFLVWSRTVMSADEAEAIVSASKNFAVDVSTKPPGAAQKSFFVRIVLPEQGHQPPAAVIRPENFIHDGTRRSEVADGYGWLWVEEERHIRMLLGQIPSHFKRLRVIVPKAFTTQNLQSARLLLNGEVVPSEVEIWEEGVGAVAAELPADMLGETVLGFSVRTAERLSDGTSVLAACIDKIEFFA